MRPAGSGAGSPVEYSLSNPRSRSHRDDGSCLVPGVLPLRRALPHEGGVPVSAPEVAVAGTVSFILGRCVYAVSPVVNFHTWELANAMYDGWGAGHFAELCFVFDHLNQAQRRWSPAVRI